MPSTVRPGNRFSCGIGRVSVRITSRALPAISRSYASPDSTPCVATRTTSFAPCSSSCRAAVVLVTAVSIMSSTTTQVRPSTSPTTRVATTSLARNGSRVLWMNAIGRPPSRSAHFSASLVRPASGETIVRSSPR